jgi:outer membrane protein assembly factor BamB
MKLKLFIILMSFVFLTAYSYADKYDWPCGAHDASGTHFQDSEKIINTSNVGDLYVKWFKGGCAVVASPCIASGKIYYGDAKGVLRAAQVADGAEVWNSKLGSTGLTSSPTINDDCIYTGCHVPAVNGTQEISHLLEVKRKSGKVGWKSYAEGGDSIPLFECAPAYEKNLIIAGTSSREALEDKNAYQFQGGMYAFDEKTGFLKWRYQFTDISAGEGGGVDVCSSPSLDNSLGCLYVATGNSYEEPASDRSCALLCLNYLTDKREGELIWGYQFEQNGLWSKKHIQGKYWGVKGTPLLFKSGSKKLVGISDNQHIFQAFDRKTGKVAWSISLIPPNEVPLPIGSSSAACDEENVYATANYATGSGFSSKLFMKPLTDEKQQSIVKFLSQQCKSTVTAIKAKTGTIKWQKRFDGANLACVSVANKLVYAAFFNGILRALDAESGKTLFEYRTGPAPGIYGLPPYNLSIPLNTTPIISNGMVFVGGGYFFPQTLNKAISGGLFAFELPSS